MNLTWSKNTLLYLSTGEDDRNLMTSSSKSRRKKVNRYFVDGVRRYGQLCKFREREKKNQCFCLSQDLCMLGISQVDFRVIGVLPCIVTHS